MKRLVCLIEDDPILGEALVERLEMEGYECEWFKNGRAALSALAGRPYQVVVSDIRLPDMGGDQLFELLLAEGTAMPPFIFITGHGAIDQAVRLLKMGAEDYLAKPFDVAALLEKLRRLCERAERVVGAAQRLGLSSAMRGIEAMLPRLAASASTVLITGESGVGKEWVARALHRCRDPEGRLPFVAVNCGAIAETLLEAELFGHEKGAFTGASRDRKGLFEQAHGGMLFLDEIGDMPLSMQVKLLRAIQEKAIVRVGGDKLVSVDIHLICATHCDLKRMVEEGAFREDLYYRVHVVCIDVPPLRERKEDILWFADRFLDELGGRSGTPRALAAGAISALTDYPWPGNVRELRHCLERACILSSEQALTAEALFGPNLPPRPPAMEAPRESLGVYLETCERRYIEGALASNAGRIADTAANLGISRKNLWEKMRKLGMHEREAAAPEPKDAG